MRPIEFIQSIDRALVAEDLKNNQTHDPYSAAGDFTVKHLQEETLHKQTSVNETEAEEAIHPDDKKKDSQSHRRESLKKDSGEEPILESQEPDKGALLDLLG